MLLVINAGHRARWDTWIQLSAKAHRFCTKTEAVPWPHRSPDSPVWNFLSTEAPFSWLLDPNQASSQGRWGLHTRCGVFLSAWARRDDWRMSLTLQLQMEQHLCLSLVSLSSDFYEWARGVRRPVQIRVSLSLRGCMT